MWAASRAMLARMECRCDVDKRDGLSQACGEQQGEEWPTGKLGLGIGGKMAIDDSRHVHLLKQRSDEGQGPELVTIVTAGRAEPMNGHGEDPRP